MATTELIYEGPASAIALVAGTIERDGLEVQVTGRVVEQKSGIVQMIVVPILVQGAYDLLKLAIDEVRKEYPNVKLWIRGEDPPKK